jgi:hypothetical protein
MLRIKQIAFVLFVLGLSLLLGVELFVAFMIVAINYLDSMSPPTVMTFLATVLLFAIAFCIWWLVRSVSWEHPFKHLKTRDILLTMLFVVIGVSAGGLALTEFQFGGRNLELAGDDGGSGVIVEALPPTIPYSPRPELQIPNAKPTPSPGYPAFPLHGFPNPSSYVALSLGNYAYTGNYFDAGIMLRSAAKYAGYPDLRHYNTVTPNGGLALVSMLDLERIDDQGVRATLNPFDLNALSTLRNFTVREILLYLFTAPEGRYRFIIVVISDEPPLISSETMTEQLAQTLLDGGAPYIDYMFQSQPVTELTQMHILIYEFIKPRDQDPRMLGPGRLPADIHLAGSRLAEGIGR